MYFSWSLAEAGLRQDLHSLRTSRWAMTPATESASRARSGELFASEDDA